MRMFIMPEIYFILITQKKPNKNHVRQKQKKRKK